MAAPRATASTTVFGNFTSSSSAASAIDRLEVSAASTSAVAPTQQSGQREVVVATADSTVMSFPIVEASLLVTVLATFALVVNLYLLNCSRYLRKPISVNLRLCCSLTASNALCAIFYVLSNLVNVLLPAVIEHELGISNCFSILIEILKFSTFFASVFTLLSLALNHYFGIIYPLKRHAITPNAVRLVIFLAHFVPTLAYIGLFSIAPGGFRAPKAFGFFNRQGCQGSRIFQIFEVRVAIAMPFIIFVLIISALYVHILMHMTGRGSSDPILNASSKNKPATNRRLFITIMLLVGSAILGWLPTLIQYILICRECLFQLPIQYSFYIGVFSQVVNVLKLLADAFIYASRLIEIRYAIWMFHQVVREHLPGFGRKEELEVPSKFARYIKSTQTQSTSLGRQNKRLIQYDVSEISSRRNSAFLSTATSVQQQPPQQQATLVNSLCRTTLVQKSANQISI